MFVCSFSFIPLRFVCSPSFLFFFFFLWKKITTFCQRFFFKRGSLFLPLEEKKVLFVSLKKLCFSSRGRKERSVFLLFSSKGKNNENNRRGTNKYIPFGDVSVFFKKTLAKRKGTIEDTR